MRYIKYLIGFIYSIVLRFYGVKIHPLARITPESKFEGMNKINKYTVFINSFLGRGSYINNSSFFSHTKIGKFCSIGANTQVIAGFHPLNNNVSTHPSFYSLKKQAGFTFSTSQLFTEERYADTEEKYYLIIENDVWIGTNVLLKSGITIKTGAVIGAGSVVTKDVEPYTVVAGVPAKKIKSRFSEAEIEYLLKSRWWDKPISWIKINYAYFQNIESFKNLDESNINKK